MKAGGRERGGQVGLASPSRVQAVAANEAGHAEGCAEVADEGRSEAASEATEREVMSEKKRPQGVYPRSIVRGGRTETVYDAVHEAPRVDGRRKKTWKRGFATQREAVAWRDSQRVGVRSGGYVAPDRGSVVSRSIPRPPVSCAGTARQVERRLAAGAIWQETDLVFTRADGTALRPDHVSRTFASFASSSGVPVIRLHDLRHTSATLMLLAGVPAKVASSRLGHSNIAVTLDTYTTVLPKLDEDAAASTGSLIYGSG